MLVPDALKLLHRLKLGRDITFVETLQSSVTTSWGVAWDETYIARDLMQNFFDANRQQLAEVRVTADGLNVSVQAPAPFNLRRLFYLGSEKGGDDVGQYGEGFKAGAMCLLRDHRVTPIAASGHDIAVLRVADQAVPDTRMFPILYDFYRTEAPVAGSKLVLVGCSRKLADAMADGMSHFFHEGNPALGQLRWKSRNGHFAVYASADGKGHVFYRKLRRGGFDGIPAVLVIDKEYAAIQKLVQRDRDRNAFGDELLKKFFDVFASSGLRDDIGGQRAVLELARPSWVRGHPLLSEVADHIRYRSRWTRALAAEVFGAGFFCPSKAVDPAQQLAFDGLERQWRESGKECLPGYFSRFGVLNAEAHLKELREKALEEEKRENRRLPTPNEVAAINVLLGAMRELSPVIAGVFAKRKTHYTVANTETLLGQLRKDRGHRSLEVFLSATVFTSDFGHALAVFLHEHAHVFGYDGDRGFTDALTELLETVITRRDSLDGHEALWVRAREKVKRDRRDATREQPGFKGSVKKMSEDELRALIDQIPEAVLRKYGRFGAEDGR